MIDHHRFDKRKRAIRNNIFFPYNCQKYAPATTHTDHVVGPSRQTQITEREIISFPKNKRKPHHGTYSFFKDSFKAESTFTQGNRRLGIVEIEGFS